MANPIDIRSYQQILGPMIAALKENTDITDLYKGAVNLTTMQAAATSDQITEAKLLKILNYNNVDKVGGADLKSFAADIGLIPPFIGSSPSSVFLTIKESAFTKISTTVYAGANNPIAGAQQVLIVDGSAIEAYSPTGTVYLGRNTPTYESATYVSVTNSFNGYWTLQLSSPLVKDHLVGEEVVLAQGGDRTWQIGLRASVPSSSGSPQIDFAINNSGTMPDGEDTAANIAAICQTPGSTGQVGDNRVNLFQSPPWSTATVTNPAATTGGIDAETDPELRQRIKDWWSLISRGVPQAIRRSVIGLTDTDQNDTIVSAYLAPPVKPGQYTILYIDNGAGLVPAFSGVGSETIIQSAAGTESRFQVQQFPVVKAQLISASQEPFNLQGTETIAFSVDNVSEQATFSNSPFAVPGQATAQEVVQQINLLFESVEARTAGGLIFVSPTADDPEYVQSIPPLTGTDGNLAIAFPPEKEYTLRLYEDDVLLSKNGIPAVITSLPSSQWSGLTSSETLQLSTDGIDGPLVTLTDAIFAAKSSSLTLAQASPLDWAEVLNTNFIGITAQGNTNNTFSISSNRGNSSQAEITVIGGSLATKIFSTQISATGKSSDYSFNRLAGTGQLVKRPAVGAQILAGDSNTQGFADSIGTTTGTFNLPLVNTFASQMVLTDAPVIVLTAPQQGTLTFTAPSGNIQRIQSSISGYFSNLLHGDWVHLFNLSRNALLRVYRISSASVVISGDNTGAVVELLDPNPASGSNILDDQTNLLSSFRTDGRPQLVTLPSGSTVSTAAIVASINSQTAGLETTALSNGGIRIQTDRYSNQGAMGIPVVTWSAQSALNFTLGSYQSNDPQVAAVESADLAGLPRGRILDATPDLIAPYDTLTVSGTPFDSTYANRGVLTYFGAAESSYRYPQLRNSTSQLTLRELTLAPWVEIGTDLRATTTAGVELGEQDNVVVQLDQNSTQKQFNVPMYLQATVSGPFSPSTTQLDAQDNAGNLLGTSATWAGFRFEDYRVWLQARADITAPANAELRIQSNKFGPNGEAIQFGYFYPTVPGQAQAMPVVAIDSSNNLIDVQVSLSSGASIGVGTANGQTVFVDVIGSSPWTYKVQFVDPVNLVGLTTGQDVVYLQGSQFNAANRMPLMITSVANLRDAGKIYSSSGATVTISAPPSFTIATGDVIQAGGNTYRITAVGSQTSVTVSPTPSPALSSAAGTVSRVYVSGTSQLTMTTESQTLVNGTDVLIYPVGGQQASVVMAQINQTAQSAALVTASLTPGNDGTGVIYLSTADQLNNEHFYIGLQNSQTYVETTGGVSPGLTFKEPLDFAPSIGDKLVLIPATCQNVLDHLSKKQITGLTIASGVNLISSSRGIQIATDTTGGTGQVYVSGGKAVGNTSYALRNVGQALSGSRGVVEMDASVLEQLSPGQTIKIVQQSSATKPWPGTMPISSDTIALSVTSGLVTATLSQDFALPYSFTYSGTVIWVVRKLSRSRMRYEVLSGTATIPSLIESDWVLVGNGISSYTGTTPATFSVPANQGWFQIRDTDGSTYFDVDNSDGVEDLVTTTVAPFIFASYASARPGDMVVLGAGLPVGQNNQGSFVITAVPSNTTIQFMNANASNISSTPLGASGVTALQILDQGYTTYRQIVAMTPKPSNPTNRVLCVVSPGTNIGLLTEGQGAQITLQNRLGFSTNPVNGKNGYAYWIGIKREAQRVVDGLLSNIPQYPGQKASGVFLEARESPIQFVSLAFLIQTTQGITLNTISDYLKSIVQGYVNGLGLGQPVVIGEIISLLQQAPGVFSAVPVVPTPGTATIPVLSNAQAKTNASLITLTS